MIRIIPVSILLPILVISVFISGCSKEESKKWIVVHGNIKSSATNEPANVYLHLLYRFEGEEYGSDEYEVEQFGLTNNGTYRIEEKFHKKIESISLLVEAAMYYTIPGETTIVMEKELSITSDNIVDILVDPVYLMNISLKNVSCYDDTDTLWVSFINPETQLPKTEPYFGCMDQEVGGLPEWQHEAEYSFEIKSKKNGVVTETVFNGILAPEIINELVIEY